MAADAWNKKYGKNNQRSNNKVATDKDGHFSQSTNYNDTDIDKLGFSLNNNMGFSRQTKRFANSATHTKDGGLDYTEIAPWQSTQTYYNGNNARRDSQTKNKQWTDNNISRNYSDEAENEIYKMQNGEHRYIPGRGWQ